MSDTETRDKLAARIGEAIDDGLGLKSLALADAFLDVVREEVEATVAPVHEHVATVEARLDRHRAELAAYRRHHDEAVHDLEARLAAMDGRITATVDTQDMMHADFERRLDRVNPVCPVCNGNARPDGEACPECHVYVTDLPLRAQYPSVVRAIERAAAERAVKEFAEHLSTMTKQERELSSALLLAMAERFLADRGGAT